MDQEESKWMGKVRCPADHLNTFLRQFSIMLAAGVPIVRALDTLSHQEQHLNFGEAVITMSKKVGEGYTLSRVLRFFPRLFGPVHCAMVEIGERTGSLSQSLSRLADWGERDLKLYRDVKGALTYPLTVLSVALTLTLVLFMTVVPSFVSIFEDQNLELPWITRILVVMTKLVSNPGAWIVAVTALTLGTLEFRRFYRTPRGALYVYRALTHLPAVGPLLVQATTSRYAGVLGTLLEAGLDLLTAIRLAAQSSGSALFVHDSERLAGEIQEGQSLGESYSARKDIYPSILSEMTMVGEETSRVAPAMKDLSSFMDLEVSTSIETLSVALEPILLLFVSTLVGTILLAVILPLYGLLNQLGL